MKFTTIRLAIGAVSTALGVSCVSPARAQDTIVERTETTGPNRALLRSGLAVFALSYVPAVVVAASNSRSDDNYLYIPVAGPWLDLSRRQNCGMCDNETLNKALIITDGIFQGIGALEFATSFLFVETTTVREAAAPKPETQHLSLKIGPAAISSGYGIMAMSKF